MNLFIKYFLMIFFIFIFSNCIFAENRNLERPISANEVETKLVFLKNELQKIENDLKNIDNQIIKKMFTSATLHAKNAAAFFNEWKFNLALSEINKAISLMDEIKNWLENRSNIQIQIDSIKKNELKNKLKKIEILIENYLNKTNQSEDTKIKKILNDILILFNEAKKLINEDKYNLAEIKIKRMEELSIILLNRINFNDADSLKSKAEMDFEKLKIEIEKILEIKLKIKNYPNYIQKKFISIEQHFNRVKILLIEKRKYKLAIDEIKIVHELINNLQDLLQKTKDIKEKNSNLSEKAETELNNLDKLFLEVKEKIKAANNEESLLLFNQSENLKKIAKNFYYKKQYPASIENIYSATRLILRALDKIERNEKKTENIEEFKALHKYEKSKELLREACKISQENPQKDTILWFNQAQIKKEKGEALLQNKKFNDAEKNFQESIDFSIKVITSQ